MTEELIHTDYDPEFDFRDLPKVSLHDHLDGGLRPQTIIELAAEVNHKLPETEAEALGDWFRESADSGSLPRYLETFEHTLAVMQTREALIRVAREFVEDLAEDGVIYGEVRYAPEQHLREGLSLDDVVDAVQEGLDQACEALNAEGHPMQIGQVLSAMRQSDQSVEIAKLALRHRGHGVVAFDIAGPEDGFPPSRMKEAFDLLAENLFPTTIHAGEAAGLDSIKDAILVGRAQRLGHGVRVAEDIEIEFGAIDENGEELSDDTGLVSLGPVANWVRERGIPLEICPSSNLQTGATAKFGEGIRNHPIDLLVQTGFNVTISPDNRLMSGTSLSDEFELLVEGFDYDLEDLLDLTLNAAEAAFVPLEMRELLVEYINDYYDSLLDDEDEPGEFDEDEYENVAD